MYRLHRKHFNLFVSSVMYGEAQKMRTARQKHIEHLMMLIRGFANVAEGDKLKRVKTVLAIMHYVGEGFVVEECPTQTQLGTALTHPTTG